MWRVFVTAVGGLTSPVKGPYTEPLYIANKPPDSLPLVSRNVDHDEVEEHLESVQNLITTGRKMKELDDEEEEEAEEDELKPGLPCSPRTLIYEPNHKRSNKLTTVSELELRKLERGELPFTFFSLFCVSYPPVLCLFETLLMGFLVYFQISTWAVCPSLSLLRCRCSSCLVSAVTLIQTGNHGIKR